MKKYIFSVSGMSCAMCEGHINDSIRGICDADSVKSSRKKNETVVIADTLDTEAIKKALSDLGYEANLTEEKQSIFRCFGRWKK